MTVKSLRQFVFRSFKTGRVREGIGSAQYVLYIRPILRYFGRTSGLENVAKVSIIAQRIDSFNQVLSVTHF